MRELTAEIRADLKAKWGPELRFTTATVETEEGDEVVSIVVRKPSQEDFDTVVDAGARPKERFEAIQNCVIKYAVWPSASEINIVFNVCPTISNDAWNEMEVLCGSDGLEKLSPGSFATLTEAEMTAAGITSEHVATWKAADKRRRCLVFRTPAGLWICRRPGQSEYASYRRLRDAGKISEALRGLVTECGVYPDEDKRATQIEKLASITVAVGLRLASENEKAKTVSGGI